jgi:hypothetical protein
LADPSKHWRDNFSAKSLAKAWEAAAGLPPEIGAALASTPGDAFANAEAYFAVPEYKVDLKGGERASQTDLLVLGRAAGGPFAMAVEGKVDESFGPLLGGWQNNASDGKLKRWSFLCRTLGISRRQSPTLRYQLFHRAASAVIAAERHHAGLAILLVHSFSPKDTGLTDFAAFVRLFGADATPGTVRKLTSVGGIQLYAGWVRGSVPI